MLARCVNENCTRPLHSFSEGRLFQFEVVSISLAATDDTSASFDEKPQKETVHFWLCGKCAGTFTLVLEPARGLKLLTLEEADSHAAEHTLNAPEIMHAKRC
jgi:predicted metal-binding protein